MSPLAPGKNSIKVPKHASPGCSFGLRKARSPGGRVGQRAEQGEPPRPTAPSPPQPAPEAPRRLRSGCGAAPPRSAPPRGRGAGRVRGWRTSWEERLWEPGLLSLEMGRLRENLIAPCSHLFFSGEKRSDGWKQPRIVPSEV